MGKKKRQSKAELAVAAPPTRSPSPPPSDEDEAVEVEFEKGPPVYKDDINAFNAPIEEGKDLISGMPNEILSDILSYLVVHHDPERALRLDTDPKNFREIPHPFLSLAAMSRHFRDHTENFCHRHLMQHKDWYNFRTTAELEAAQPALRRSERLKAKPVTETRCYRKELHRRLVTRCFQCNIFSWRSANLANGVSCCYSCEPDMFGVQINLTEAVQRYDLRDWMLIPTRRTGPKTKNSTLPVIRYGAVRSGKYWNNGMGISYRFLNKDVRKLAEVVHSDVDTHVAEKAKQRKERRIKKTNAERSKIMVSLYEDMLEDAVAGDDKEERVYFRGRIKHWSDPDRKHTRSCEQDIDDIFGPYSEEHRRTCYDDDCDLCMEGKMRKYIPWYC